MNIIRNVMLAVLMAMIATIPIQVSANPQPEASAITTQTWGTDAENNDGDDEEKSEEGSSEEEEE